MLHTAPFLLRHPAALLPICAVGIVLCWAKSVDRRSDLALAEESEPVQTERAADEWTRFIPLMSLASGDPVLYLAADIDVGVEAAIASISSTAGTWVRQLSTIVGTSQYPACFSSPQSAPAATHPATVSSADLETGQ